MAFLNKVGSLLKQTVSKHINSDLSVSKPSLFQAIRSMSSSSKLFVGGLSYNTDETSLRDAFGKYGDVVEARVILDRDTGRSRGFAFITYASTEAASSAIQAFDGQDFDGRRIRVNYATERPRREGFGGGYGSGGGYNYGGQGGSYGGGGYGYQGSGGGYQGGGYGGGSSDGNYSSRDGNLSGGGGFGGPPSGGDGFGGAGSFSSGGGSGYSAAPVQDDGGNDAKYTGNFSGFSSLLDKETTGSYNDIKGPQGGDDNGLGENFGQDTSDDSEKDDSNEPNDYVNTRG